MVSPCDGRPADHHMTIARCLYLLESVPLDQPIKGREYLIKEPDELYGFGLAPRAVKPAKSANRMDASSYLSAITAPELFSRLATMAGGILPSRASERSYSRSAAAWAVSASRMA